MNLRTKQTDSILPTPLVEHVKVIGIESPIMIVLNYNEEDGIPAAWCGWFDKNNQWNRDIFSKKILEKVTISMPSSDIKNIKNFNPYIMGDDDKDKLREYLSKGMKIPVIKMYREFTGKGLKESKEAVEFNWDFWYNLLKAGSFIGKNIYLV